MNSAHDLFLCIDATRGAALACCRRSPIERVSAICLPLQNVISLKPDDELLLSIQIIHACQLMLLLVVTNNMISSKAILKMNYACTTIKVPWVNLSSHGRVNSISMD
jgi:hypothetical protein